MATTAEKIKELKDLLGQDAALTALNEAERREKEAEAAGIQSKEITTKDDDEAVVDDGAVSLSDLLAEIDAGIEQGLIVNDLDAEEVELEDEEDAETKEVDDDAEFEGFVALVKEIATEVANNTFDAKMVQLKELFVPKAAERNAQVETLTKGLKEAQALTKRLQSEIDELTGAAPRKTKERGFRASTAAETEVGENSTVKNAAPGPDPLAEFIDSFVAAN